jgi:hypothetical protein
MKPLQSKTIKRLIILGGPGSGRKPTVGYVIERVHGSVFNHGDAGTGGLTPWDVEKPFATKESAQSHLDVNNWHDPANKSYARVKTISDLTKKQQRNMMG